MSVISRKACRVWVCGCAATSDRVEDLFATAMRLEWPTSWFRLSAQRLLPHFVLQEPPPINSFVVEATPREFVGVAQVARREIFALAGAAAGAHLRCTGDELSAGVAAHVAAAVLAWTWSWA